MNYQQFRRILLQTLLLPVLSLAVVAGILLLLVLSAQKSATRIQNSDAIIASATEAQKLIVDQETGLRGYQVTADARFLKPYREADVPLDRALTALRASLQVQHEDLSELNAIVAGEQTWQDSYAKPLIALIAAGGDSRDVDLNLHGMNQMESLRARVNVILRRESTLRLGEVARWHVQVSYTVEAVLSLALLAGVFISITTVRSLHRVSSAYQGTLEGLRRHAQSTFESEERLRTTLTSIGDGVIVTGPDGSVELLNPAATELTGWTTTEAAGRPLADILCLVRESTREPLETPVANIIRLGRLLPATEPAVLLRRDGTEVFVDESGAPILDRSGKLTGVVIVVRDISQQRQAQTTLVATEKLATAGRIAATIAHEMHNPLDSVVNLLYLLREQPDSATAMQYLDLAQAELARMGQVSRAMLGLYRESHAPVPIDVHELLTSVLLLLESQLTKAGVTLVRDLPEGLTIDAFPAELRQVFTNLIANAAEATPRGGCVTVSARPARARGASGMSRPGASAGVEVTIADNGVGIEPVALSHLFEPFFTTKGEQGTGLGLWVSRGIIEKHGGSIEIQSYTAAERPTAHGTAITLFLPHRATSAR